MRRLKRKAPLAWAGCGADGLRGTNPLCAYKYTPKEPKIQASFWNEEKGGGL